jgi:hypothetical protein
MSLLCRWKRRVLEQAALAEDDRLHPPALKAHLDRCASCRRYWQELRALSWELSALSEPLPASDRFSELIWARIAADPVSTKRLLPFAPILAVAAVLILGFLLWSRNHLSSPNGVVKGEGAQVASTSASKTLSGGPGKQNSLVSEEHRGADHSSKQSMASRAPLVERDATSTHSRRRVAAIAPPKYRAPLRRKTSTRTYARRYRRHRDRAALLAKRQTKPSGSQRIASVPPRPKWEQWSQWGAFYASHGDYQRAATAYASAYAERPDPELALAAGQAAENAGDVTQALAYYSRILNRPSAKKSPEKGTSLWNHANDTV